MEWEETLQECMAAAERLLGLLEEDLQDMSYCIGGGLLAEYRRGAEQAMQETLELRDGLRRLDRIG